MKINFKFLKPKKVYKKDNFVINPNVYWRVVIYIGLVAIFGSFGYGFYLFKEISREPEIPESNIVNNAKKIKKDRLEKIDAYFYTKEKKFQEILSSPLLIRDPSMTPVVTPPPTTSVPSVGIEPTSRP